MRYLTETKLVNLCEDRCQYPTFHLINQFNMVFIFVLTGMCWISGLHDKIHCKCINIFFIVWKRNIDCSRNWYTSHVRALNKISIAWWWVVIRDINNKKKIWFAVKMIKNVNFQLIVLNCLIKACYFYSSFWKDESELCRSRQHLAKTDPKKSHYFIKYSCQNWFYLSIMINKGQHDK